MQCRCVRVHVRHASMLLHVRGPGRGLIHAFFGALTRGKIAYEQDGSSAAVNVGIPFDSGGVYLLDSRGYVAKKLYIICADAVSLSDFAPGHVMTTYTMCY